MQIEWAALQALRAVYLEERGGTANYWTSETLLDSYDQTFARRIAWKWQWALRELTRRRWVPPEGGILDWGCGTGVGAREFLRWDGSGNTRPVYLHDRSAAAMDFASRALRRENPNCQVHLRRSGEAPAVLLASHVLTELDERGMAELIAVARIAQSIVCVEPGTRVASERIVALRQALLGEFQPVAPCTHAAACGLLTPENARHWCHFFGEVPGEIFSDRDWVRFGKVMGIDLRSLPLSFMVMDRCPPPAPPPDAVRVLGRPRVYKGFALLLGCGEPGVAEHRFQKRADPACFRRLEKERSSSLQHWRLTADGEILAASDIGDAIGR